MSEIPYSTICVSGEDAGEFLQGQLTADVREFGAATTRLTAWCNPKGRVIAVMNAWRDGENYCLALPTELAERTLQRLTIFRFRSKVDFEVRTTTMAELGIDADIDAWRLARLQAGIPEIYTAQSEQFTAHMLNLDLLGAVSLDKGCYTGQEIISRTHYRGASKRRLHRFQSSTPVFAGDPVTANARNVGEVVNAIGTDLLAVIPMDMLEEELLIGEQRITPVGKQRYSGEP